MAQEELEITPIKVGEIPRILVAIKSFAELLMVDEIDWVAVITQHGEQLLAAMAIAARKPQAWIDALSLDEAVVLATTLFEVNSDFFVQRVAPALQASADRINAQLAGR
jgi:hypothetical protein